MGKFLQNDSMEKNLINNYFDNYLDTTEKYSKWIQGAPTFVTYYSISLEGSTQDEGLNNVIEIVGGESPIKYKKIENFPIYLEGDMNFELNYEDDAGFDGESEGNAIILPSTIIPQNDDLIIFEFLESKYIYRVANVESSNTSIRSFYKINFVVSPFDIETLEKRQVIENYDVIYNNIGTELDPVVSKKEFTFITEIDKILEYLSERYIKFYYDKKVNSFIYNKEKVNLVVHDFYKDNGIYDPKLAIFIKNNNLFINKKTFLKNIYVESVLKDRDLDYENSFYSLLETLDTEEFKYPFFYFIPIKESVFMLMQDKFHELVHNPIEVYKGSFKKNYTDEILKSGSFMSVDIIKYIKDKNLVIDNLPINEKIIIIYLRCLKYEEQNNILDYLEDIVKLAKEIRINKDLFSYIQIPCIIYILKEIKKITMRATNYIS